VAQKHHLLPLPKATTIEQTCTSIEDLG